MKFDMSEAWRDATAMMSGNREVLLVLAGLFFFLPGLVLGLATGDMQALAIADPENASEVMMSIYAEWWWLLLLVSIAGIVGFLGLLALLCDRRRPTVGEAIRIGIVGLLPALGTYIPLVLGLGFVVGVLQALAQASGNPAIAFMIRVIVTALTAFVTVRMSLSGPVIAIEKVRNPLKVLGRSWNLTRGNTVRLFLFYLLLIVVYLVVSMVVGIVIGGLTLAMGEGAGAMINAILSGLIAAMFSVVIVAVIAAAHRQLSGPTATAVSETSE